MAVENDLAELKGIGPKHAAMLKEIGVDSIMARRSAGDRAARAYATPVVARPVPGGFAIPLAYGRDVDWHRNLTAAGRGVLTVHGTRYTITRPHTVPAVQVTGALTPYWRRMLRGIGEYVVVSAEPLNPAGRGGCA